MNIATGEVYGECKPTRDGTNFLAFVKKAVQPHAGKDIHVVSDNLSIHTTPDVLAWLNDNRNVHFHFTPVGSSWINQVETWLGIITRQAIRRGTLTSRKDPHNQIRDYIAHWNTNPNHLPGPPPPTRSWPKSASSRPTPRNSSITTARKGNRVTDH